MRLGSRAELHPLSLSFAFSRVWLPLKIDAPWNGKVIALYARGLTRREIQGHLLEWQSLPLDAVYPIVYIDAIHLKLRTSGAVQNQAV